MTVDAPVGTLTTYNFAWTGGSQTFTVPPHDGALRITVKGGQGGETANAYNLALGGKGGSVRGDLTASAGTTLTLVVGGKGENGSKWSFTPPASGSGAGGTPSEFGGGHGGDASGNSGYGGGGGAGSAVKIGASIVMVAGGGGGPRFETLVNIDGVSGSDGVGSGGGGGGTTGGGGTLSGPGAAGGIGATAGSGHVGGNGSNPASGGGGGGYYGGGGGGQKAGKPWTRAGGGGGSTWVDTTVVAGAVAAGLNSGGHGWIQIVVDELATNRGWAVGRLAW